MAVITLAQHFSTQPFQYILHTEHLIGSHISDAEDMFIMIILKYDIRYTLKTQKK